MVSRDDKKPKQEANEGAVWLRWDMHIVNALVLQNGRLLWDLSANRRVNYN